MLTGKAKKAFNEWRFDVLKDNRSLYVPIHNTRLMHTLIIEWLDSVGIYIDIEFFRESLKGITFISGTTTKENGFEPTKEEFPDRQSAVQQAIEQANKIYNER